MRTITLLLFFALMVTFFVSSPVNAEAKEQQHNYFHGFEYLDQNLIRRNNISRFDIAVFRDIDNKSPCMAFAYYFNSKGYISRFSPPGQGSSLVYKYNNNDRLVDYAWDDGDGNNYAWLSKAGKEDFDLRIRRISSRHQSYLNDKLKLDEQVNKRVVSACANIDGFYELSVTKIEQSLPKLIVAKLKGAPERSHLHDTSLDTPKVLFIKLNYIIEVE